MSVYDKNGTSVQTIYDIDGNTLDYGYDKDGIVVYERTQPSLTVMSFNVGCFYSEWHPAPASTGDAFYLRNKSIFEKYNTDFAGLTEWYNQIGTVSASVLMEEFFAYYHPDYTPYGSANAAITSGFSVEPNATPTLVQYQTQGYETRYYQKSYITINNKTICCIVTHLDLQSSARTAQFLELMNAVANEDYFIITGDFNFEIYSVGDSEYNKSIKVALDMGYHSAQNADSLLVTHYDGVTVATSVAKTLDNIITSPNIDIANFRRDETKLTDGLCEEYNIMIDHLPIIADLVIN